MMTRQAQQDDRSKAFHDVSALVMNIIRSPETKSGSGSGSGRGRRSITPAGFASLLLGISLSLTLCGSVTFLIGLVLMPWVVGLVIFVYFVSSISMIGKTIFCCNSYSSAPRKDKVKDKDKDKDAAPAPAPASASWKLL